MRKPRFKYKGRSFRINDAYDNILCIYEAFEDKTLTDTDKIQLAAEMLLKGHRLYLWALSDVQKADLTEQIMKSYVYLPQKGPIRCGERSLDFRADKNYIYASFQMDYGIDLIKQQGKLSWKEFIDLFQGLSDGTKIREVMRIRMMELPSYNGHNQKELQEIMELKSYYALPVKGGGGRQGLDRLFDVLEAQAVKDG